MGTFHLEDMMQAGSSQHMQQLDAVQKKLSSDDPISIQFTSVIYSTVESYKTGPKKSEVQVHIPSEVTTFSTSCWFLIEINYSFCSISVICKTMSDRLFYNFLIPGHNRFSKGCNLVSFQSGQQCPYFWEQSWVQLEGESLCLA